MSGYYRLGMLERKRCTQIDEMCRGIFTADVLAKGLSRRPSQLGSLKGLVGTKDTRVFILVRPLTMKVKAYV